MMDHLWAALLDFLQRGLLHGFHIGWTFHF